MVPRLSILAVVVSLGCGSGDDSIDAALGDSIDAAAAADGSTPTFDSGVADGAPGADAARFDASAATDALLAFDAAPGTFDAAPATFDAAPPPPDAAPPDAMGCGTLPADPIDVYVDQTSAMPSTGTQTCPFLTIAEATALTAPATTRMIHVAGSTPPLVYDEAAVVVVRPGEHLSGDGEATTRITGGSQCTIASCAVSVRGGTLSGVTVVSATGIAVEIPIGADGSTLTNVTARDSEDDGLYVRASATLANVTSRSNGRHGLSARNGTIDITNSSFDQNDNDGIFADRDVVINFTGGTASGNDSDGIFLQDSSTVTGALLHTLTDIQVIGNLSYGIYATGTASLIVRSTTMRQNEAGLVFAYGTSNTLDVGTGAQPGNNVFGGATPTQRNIRAGLCLENSGATGSQVAEGDSWASCPPTQGLVPSFTCHALNTYADVGYVPDDSGGPPVAPPASCTVGP
jgi:hypothetical protein